LISQRQEQSKSDARFQLVVEAAPNAMVMINAAGLIEMVNAQAERDFGYSRAEMLGEPVDMLLPERLRGDHSAHPNPFFVPTKKRRAGPSPELYGRRKDGSEFPVEIGLNPIETDEGVLVLSAIVDITAEKQRMADARYLAAIVESSNDAIIGKDLDGTIRSWNTAAEAILGYSAEEMIGRNISLLFPPERLAEEASIVERIRRGERVEHHETERRHKDGRDIPVSIAISPILDARGVVVGASKSLRDISERRDAQRALAMSEAEFRASFEGAAVGKVLAEPISRRILRANHALASMLGYEAADMVGRSANEFTWPEDRDADAAQYALLLNGGSDAHVAEQRFVRRHGTPIWVRVSATLARAPDSSLPVLAVIAIEDIDARYRAQAELLDAKQALEKVVEERTVALDQRDLLLREVYHRVKNNLQIVDGLLLMQALKIDDPQAKESVLGIRSRIFALGLVHQQLMGSTDLKTFDIEPFLQELSTNIVDGGASASVTISVEASALEVGLDFAVPLGLLVTELVTNSLKHAFPDGVGTIAVSLRPDAAGTVLLVVSDDGVGLPALDPEKTGRTGLGAGIVKSLVAQLEGEMAVGDGPGARTEIRIPLPAPPSQAAT
jgi:PAS domain S-box-containing protein